MNNFNSKSFYAENECFEVVDGRVTEMYTQGKHIERKENDSFEELKVFILSVMRRINTESFLDLCTNWLYNDTICSKIADLVYEEKVNLGEIDSEKYPLHVLRELSKNYKEHCDSSNIEEKFYTHNCERREAIILANNFILYITSGKNVIRRCDIDFYWMLKSSMNDMAKYDPEEFMRMYHSLTNDTFVKEIAEKIRVERRKAYNKNPFDL